MIYAQIVLDLKQDVVFVKNISDSHCHFQDYYLRRASADTADWTTEECHALLEAALEIDKGNASVSWWKMMGYEWVFLKK